MSGQDHVIELTFREITTDNELFCQFDELHGVLLLDVKNPFNAEDFTAISEIIDPYFANNGELRGVIINAKKFPYWSNPLNRNQYINFARDNHFKFKKVAFGMGGFFTKIIVGVARRYAHPQVKMFKFNKIEEAQHWILFGK